MPVPKIATKVVEGTEFLLTGASLPDDLPTMHDLPSEERARAEAEKARADTLKAQLLALGIAPDSGKE